MSKLERDEYALLELMALEPLSIIPPIHQLRAESLVERGLTMKHGTHWCATAAGLKIIGRALH